MLEKIFIQSFKHNGTLHRTWCDAYIIKKTEKMWIVVTEHSLVIDYNGRKWTTKEPAICFFYPDKWYNIIAMLRSNGIHYYCNIASPSIQDTEALKNIDYDLDIKIDNHFKYQILDEHEYALHSSEMNYSDNLKKHLENTLQQLIKEIKSRNKPFNHQYIYQLYNYFLEKIHT